MRLGSGKKERKLPDHNWLAKLFASDPHQTLTAFERLPPAQGLKRVALRALSRWEGSSCSRRMSQKESVLC